MTRPDSTLLRLVLAASFAIGVTGCGSELSPFTRIVRSQFNLSDDDVGRLQFWISARVVLERRVESGAQLDRVRGGVLITREEQTYDTVEIPEHTRGRALAVNGEQMRVSFDPETTGLMFVADPDGKYYLAGVQSDDGYVVLFEEREFRPHCGPRRGSCAGVHLLFDRDHIHDAESSRRVLRGYSVDEEEH